MSGDSLDQIFVSAKEWLLSPLAGAPDWLIQIVSSLINIAGVLGVFLTLFALISVLERKILGRIQNRYGPNRVGPFGLFQPVADGIKLLIKEDIVPARADKIVHFLAPILIAATAILTLGVIPYGRNMTPFAIDGGILFFFAVGSTTELAVFMAGWGSNNKFSMLGAMRAIAQMVSYELPLIHHHASGSDGRRLALAGCDRRSARWLFALASCRTGSSSRHGARPRSFCFLFPVSLNPTALLSMSRKANRKLSPAT